MTSSFVVPSQPTPQVEQFLIHLVVLLSRRTWTDKDVSMKDEKCPSAICSSNNKLPEEVMLFLHSGDELYHRVNLFQCVFKLPYLADIFKTFNNLNVVLQGNCQLLQCSPQQVTRLKVELWCGRLDRRKFDHFPTLADFLLSAGEDMGGGTVALFKQHLQELHSQLGRSFLE